MSPTPKIGDLLEIQTSDTMSFGTAAVGRKDGLVVFIPFAAPNEKILARITQLKKNYAEASLVQVLTPSPLRIAPPCPYFQSCGGCQWQHLKYSAQLDSKKNILLHQISRTSHIPMETLQKLLKIHAAPQEFSYRSRIQVRGDQQGIGFFAQKSKKLIHIEKCLLAAEPIQKKWSDFISNKEHETHAQKSSPFKLEWSLEKNKTIQESLNKPHSASGFSQVNEQQNEKLVSLVTEFAENTLRDKNDPILYDLYAGAGNLTQKIKGKVKIFSVESFKTKTDSQENEDSSNVQIAATVLDFLEKPLRHGKPHVIIADPPREGLVGTAQKIAFLDAERIILVSCNPATLARDLTEFFQKYEISSLHLIDMFPQTYHLESLVVLDRRQSLT